MIYDLKALSLSAYDAIKFNSIEEKINFCNPHSLHKRLRKIRAQKIP
jgi:hypothetical protein